MQIKLKENVSYFLEDKKYNIVLSIFQTQGCLFKESRIFRDKKEEEYFIENSKNKNKKSFLVIEKLGKRVYEFLAEEVQRNDNIRNFFYSFCGDEIVEKTKIDCSKIVFDSKKDEVIIERNIEVKNYF